MFENLKMAHEPDVSYLQHFYILNGNGKETGPVHPVSAAPMPQEDPFIYEFPLHLELQQ